MKIEHNAEMVKKFADIMFTAEMKHSEDRTGYHRSDAIACPLKCFWRMTGKEAIYTSKEVGLFIIGIMAHKAMHEYFDAQEVVYRFGESADAPAVTIDALYSKFPIESKSTRKQIYKKSDIPNDWIEQICFGMAVMGVNKGYLMILNVISFALMVFEFEIDDAERDLYKAVFAAKIMKIAHAIKINDSNILEPKLIECQFCPYRPFKSREGWKGCHYYNPVKKEK